MTKQLTLRDHLICHQCFTINGPL